MDTSRYRRKQAKLAYEDYRDEYPHNLSMYMRAPSSNITLTEFEDLAVERLRVLRIIEYATLVDNKVFSPEWKACILQELKKENLNKYVRLLKCDSHTKPGDIQIRRDDHISHHILRLAYCRADDLRRWFLAREMELFKLRLLNTSDESINEFMKIYNLQYTPVSDEEKMQFRDAINSSTGGHFVLDATTFYKVHFTQVMLLLQQYKVFIHNGFAYVPSYEISSCLVSQFRSVLSEFLATASKRISNVTDARLTYFFHNLNEAYTGKRYDETNKSTDFRLTPLNIEQSVWHFPLCMKMVHDIFHNVHKLKHYGRLQYTLFLKGCGMIYEDVMEYWRDEFTKVIDHDTFEKKYAYGVKHAFGKVGRLLSYSPHSCAKIIASSVGAGETHGCPYKHWDATTLKGKLEELGLNGQSVQAVLEAKQAGHFQIACGKFFQAVHQHETLKPIEHPNQFFEDSYELTNKKAENKMNDTQINGGASFTQINGTQDMDVSSSYTV